MKIILSIDKEPNKIIRYGFYDGKRYSIITNDKIIMYDITNNTSSVYDINKQYDDICYCRKQNCYYAIVFKENIIYKLSPDLKEIFIIIEEDSSYYLMIGNQKYILPSNYEYTSLIYCEPLSDSNECTIIISAEDKTSNLLLKLDTNELLHNEFDLLLNIADEENKIASDMFSAASEFESSICASSNINELISINKNMQNTIDDIIIEEYMLYKKAQNIINGT